MASLYAIADGILTAVSAVNDEGEMAPGVEEALDALQMELEDKADNVARYMKTCEAEALGFKTEAERLAKLAYTSASKAERLKKYLKEQLERIGMVKLDTELFKFAIQKNSVPAVRLSEGAAIPEEYTRIKKELDAKAVAADAKAGVVLPACLTVEYGTHLRVR